MRVCRCPALGPACRYCPNGQPMDASALTWPCVVTQYVVPTYTPWPGSHGNTKGTAERYKS